MYEFQDAKTEEIFEKTKRIQHFEATEKTCNQAIQSKYKTILLF